MNPDNLPERKFLVGAGTNRPVGFTQDEMFHLYWTVRSFDVSITTINALSDEGSISIAGPTKIKNSPVLKNRKGMIKGAPNPYDTTLIDPKQFPDIPQVVKWQTKYDVNEGTICGAGPVHTLQVPYGFVQIDFSDIIFYKRLYWPIVYIILGKIGDQVAVSTPATYTATGEVKGFSAGVLESLGGVTFRGSLIPMYIGGTASSQFTAIFGSIDIGKGCYSRFYHDDKDAEHIKQCEDAKNVTYQKQQ